VANRRVKLVKIAATVLQVPEFEADAYFDHDLDPEARRLNVLINDTCQRRMSCKFNDAVQMYV